MEMKRGREAAAQRSAVAVNVFIGPWYSSTDVILWSKRFWDHRTESVLFGSIVDVTSRCQPYSSLICELVNQPRGHDWRIDNKSVTIHLAAPCFCPSLAIV